MKDPEILTVPAFSALANLAFGLRHAVFVEEQGVPRELENDAEDLTAIHLVAVLAGDVVGTLRIVKKPEHYKIGRVAVAKSCRGKGIGVAMMKKALGDYSEECGGRFFLTSQSDKVGLYEKLGFHAFGAEFQDAGLPHMAMKTY